MNRAQIGTRVSKLELRYGKKHEESSQVQEIQNILKTYEKLTPKEKEESNKDALVWYANFLKDDNVQN